MICFLDMDGVLVDAVKGMCEHHKIPSPWLDPANLGKWDIDKLSGIKPSEFWGAFGHDFWANLPWMPDGKEILAIVEAHFGADNVCILTSPPASNQGEAIAGKIAWLEKHLPKYKRRSLFGPVKRFCAHPNACLIDDMDRNVTEFIIESGWAVLIPRPWNMYHASKYTMVDYLKEHLTVIKERKPPCIMNALPAIRSVNVSGGPGAD